MRALLVTSSYPARPADPRGTFMHRLARALVRSGAEVSVLAPGAAGAPAFERWDGVEVHRVSYWIPRWQSLTTGLSGIVPNLRARPWLGVQVPPLVAALSLRAAEMVDGFDVVHAHWLYPAGIAGAIAARRGGKPLVLTSHGGDLNLAARSGLLRRVSRRIALRADACVGVSEAMAQAFRSLGVPAGRTHFIPLGVDVDEPAHLQEPDEALARFGSSGGFRILYVGSLIPRKSVDTLLEAHARLQERGHPVSTALVGHGPEESALATRVRERAWGSVIFAGPQPPSRVPHWMDAADVLVLPSLSEGRPTVILEAMGCGKPVVASDIPGTRELVENRVTGLLVPPKEPDTLADALEGLIRSVPLRREMGERARARLLAQGLTSAQSARIHLELYTRLARA